MYLLIAFIVISVLLVGLAFFLESDVLNFIAGIAITITVIALLFIPICRYYSTSRIIEYETRQKVIFQQRNSNVSELERVELTKEILSDNVWLSESKYDINNKWISVYYDKDILNLKPIQ